MNNISKKIINELKESSGFDDETCELVLNTYISQAKDIVQDLKVHLTKKDYGKISDLLHKLKGSSGNVRFEEARILAEEAECVVKDENFEVVSTYIAMIDDKIKSLEV